MIDRFPLSDQEITVPPPPQGASADWVDDYRHAHDQRQAATDERGERPRAAAPAFADLERVRGDVVPGDRAASGTPQRMASSMEEMQDVLRRLLPRAEEAIDYCDQFPLDDLPDDALHLLYLLYSLVMVSMPVEVWHQAHVVDAGEAYFDRSVEPIP